MSPTFRISVLAAAVAALPVLGAVERHVAHPVVDVALFRDRAFAGAMLAGFLVSSPRLSLMVAAALWFQGIEGHTPLQAAGHVTGAAVGLTVGALVAEPLTRLASELRVALLAAAGSVLGLVLLAAGLAVVGWWTGYLDNIWSAVPDALDTSAAADLAGETWWPWALGVAGALLVLLGRIPLLRVHDPIGGQVQHRLTGDAPQVVGRLHDGDGVRERLQVAL